MAALVNLSNSIPPVTLTPLNTVVGVAGVNPLTGVSVIPNPGDGTLMGYISRNAAGVLTPSSNALCNNFLTALITAVNGYVGGFVTAAQKKTFRDGLLTVAQTHIGYYYRTVIQVCTQGDLQNIMIGKYDKIIASQSLLSKVVIGANHELQKAAKQAKNDPKKLKKVIAKIKALQRQIDAAPAKIAYFTTLRGQHNINTANLTTKLVDEAVARLTPEVLSLIKEDSGDYAKIARQLWPKVEEMEIDGDFKIRGDLFESQAPPQQCKFVTGDKKITDKCWICSKPLLLQTSTDPIECEHILSILPALKYLFISQSFHDKQTKKFDPATLALIQAILFMEYRNAHKCCNQAKSDINVIEMAANGLWQLNQENITEIFDKIGGAGTSWGCDTISGLSATLGPNANATPTTKVKRQNVRNGDLTTYATKIIDYLNAQVALFRSFFAGDANAAIKGQFVFDVFYIYRFFLNIPITSTFCLLTGGPYPLNTNMGQGFIANIKPMGIMLGGARSAITRPDGVRVEYDKVIILPSLHERPEFKDVLINKNIITPLFIRFIEGINSKGLRIILFSEGDIPDGYFVLFNYYNGNNLMNFGPYKTNIPYEDLQKYCNLNFKLGGPLYYYLKSGFNADLVDTVIKPENTMFNPVTDSQNLRQFNQIIDYVRSLNADPTQKVLMSLSINVNVYNVQLLREFCDFYTTNQADILAVETYNDKDNLNNTSLSFDNQLSDYNARMNIYNEYMNYINLGNLIILLFYKRLFSIDDLCGIASDELIANTRKIYLDEHSPDYISDESLLTLNTYYPDIFNPEIFPISASTSVSQVAATAATAAAGAMNELVERKIIEKLKEVISLIPDCNLKRALAAGLKFVEEYLKIFLSTVQPSIIEMSKDMVELLYLYRSIQVKIINAQAKITNAPNQEARDSAEAELAAAHGEFVEFSELIAATQVEIAANFNVFRSNDAILNEIFDKYNMYSAFFVLMDNKTSFNSQMLCFSEFFLYEKKIYLSTATSSQDYKQKEEFIDLIDNKMSDIIELYKFLKSIEFNGGNFPESDDFKRYSFAIQYNLDVSEIKPEILLASTDVMEYVLDDTILRDIAGAFEHKTREYKVVDLIDKAFDAYVAANLPSLVGQEEALIQGMGLGYNAPPLDLSIINDVKSSNVEGSPTGFIYGRSISDFDSGFQVPETISNVTPAKLKMTGRKVPGAPTKVKLGDQFDQQMIPKGNKKVLSTKGNKGKNIGGTRKKNNKNKNKNINKRKTKRNRKSKRNNNKKRKTKRKINRNNNKRRSRKYIYS
jgi:hypothetical protein